MRGGDPVGSMAAAFSKVSITSHDIREEFGYLTDIHYGGPHARTHAGRAGPRDAPGDKRSQFIRRFKPFFYKVTEKTNRTINTWEQL